VSENETENVGKKRRTGEGYFDKKRGLKGPFFRLGTLFGFEAVSPCGLNLSKNEDFCVCRGFFAPYGPFFS
jgi:hypothetical protein